MNKYYEKSKKAYDKKSEKYDKSIAGRFTLPMKMFLLSKFSVKKNDKVLDVACGNGWFLSELFERKQIQGYGIDISPKMIEIAKGKYPSINFQVGSSDKLEYKENFFDIITVNAAFHHFPEPEKFIMEAQKCLKTNGKIYITEIYVPPIIRHVFNLFMPISKNGDYKLYAPKEIKNLYEQVGIKNIEIFKQGYTEIIVGEK